jgi:hypothetical protein
MPRKGILLATPHYFIFLSDNIEVLFQANNYPLDLTCSPNAHMLRAWFPVCGAIGRLQNLSEVGPVEGHVRTLTFPFLSLIASKLMRIEHLCSTMHFLPKCSGSGQVQMIMDWNLSYCEPKEVFPLFEYQAFCLSNGKLTNISIYIKWFLTTKSTLKQLFVDT